MLCLANGQRIKLPQTFSFIFEMKDLDQINPSTVSRCGLIYIDKENLEWSSLIENWFSELQNELSNKYLDM